MAKTPKDPVLEVVEALQDGVERQASALAEVAARMSRLHEDVRRSLELAARLKLATDNAKGAAASHQEALGAVEKRLSAIEQRLAGKAAAKGGATKPKRLSGGRG